MAYCFIISSNIDFVNSTEKFVEKNSYYKPVKILLRDAAYTHWIESYKCISEKFAAIPFADLRESVVLVDEYFNIRKSNPIENNVDTHVFWGRMILSFPEIRFLFLNSATDRSENIIDWLINESRSSKNFPFVPLFDYTGIRNIISKNCNSGLVERTDVARIIDDEQAYAYFHAYIAYKRNYLCKLYTTLNHLETEKERENKGVHLQIQDLSLGFIDKRDDVHLLDMFERYKKFPFLKNVEADQDFVITSGQEHNKVKAKYIFINKIKKAQKIVGILPGKKSILVQEKVYFIWLNDSEDAVKECDYCKLKSHDLNYKVEQIYKPTKGLYDIEKKLRLKNKTFKKRASNHEKNNGHSAPGVLAFIAENLIVRSQQILDNAKQVVDAIHAAILALEAKELLNGLTPTLALQAFTLQQKAEVMAECLFVGTEYNIDLKPRFIEIKTEVNIISKRFADSERKRVQLNTQLVIAETLSGVYSSHKQFEEELECLNRSRNLNFKLRGEIIGFLLRPLSWAMNSVRNFGIFLLLMQFIFAFFYYLLLKNYNETWLWDISWEGIKSELISITNAFLYSILYFFTHETSATFDQGFKDHQVLSNRIHEFQKFCSSVSLSVFMGMIILRFSRR